MSGIAWGNWRVPVLITLAGLLALPCAFASTDSEGEPSLETVWKMVQEGHVLPAIVLAEKLYGEKRLRSADYAQLLAIVGDEAGVERILARPNPSAGTQNSVGDESFSTAPALDAIVDLAKSRRVVILNESHYDQRHRAFAQLLATRLREIGFTFFAAETFSPSIANSMSDGAPDGQSGVYVADPVFGDLVRQSTRMGYKLFSYEQTAAQNATAQLEKIDSRLSRENAQAQNISALLRDMPDARIFVYVGGSHLLEVQDPDGREWMAALLRRLSGIDPLTIDQISGTPHASPARESSLYKRIKPFLGRRISVAINEAGSYVTKDGVDLVVFHPDIATTSMRPRWLFMCGYRHPYDIALGVRRGRWLIRAFLHEEPPGSIPVDQVIITRGERIASLMLPAGKYRIEAQSENGSNSVLLTSYNTSKRKVSKSFRDYLEAISCE